MLKPACLGLTCPCTGLESVRSHVSVICIQSPGVCWVIVWFLSQQEIILSVHKEENLKTMPTPSAFEVFLLRIRNKYIYNSTNCKGERLFPVVTAHCFKTASSYLQILIIGRKDWY